MKRILLLLILSAGLTAQFGYNHPELEWQTIEGEHFVVHFHQNTEWTANEALFVAEDVYPAVTGLYGYRPEEKTHLIIRDTDDFANGAAYYFDNKIDIWAMPLDYSLRGSHYWLRDVITHEFTHIVSLRASRKLPGQIPAGYLQVIEYEPERRQDVLYGYPNGIAAYPLPSVQVPMWWAEGIAQQQSDAKRFDWRDGIREMILRDMLSYDKFMEFDEMDGFGKDGVGNEAVYNFGFAFVNYLVERFGEDVLQAVTREIASPLHYGFYRALERATGVSREALHQDWVQGLKARYSQMFPAGREPTPITFIQREGSANYHPRYDGVHDRLGYISNQAESYMSRTSLVVVDTAGEKETLIPQAEGFDWAPDGDRIVFVRKEYYDGGIPPRRHAHTALDPEGMKTLACPRCEFLLSGSRFADLFVASADDPDDEIRLTQGERVKSPAWSPAGEIIAYVNLRDGTNNLCLAYADHPDRIEQLTHYGDGTQIYTVRWSRDGRFLVFDHTRGTNRDISRYDRLTGTFEPLLQGRWDERDPVFLDDSTLLFSDDRSGIFNLYTLDLQSGVTRRMTHVNGGAFQPEPAGDGVYYALYDSLGYNIAFLERKDWLDLEPVERPQSLNRIPEVTWDSHAHNRPTREYTLQYGPMFILPRLQIEIDRLKGKTIVKPGFYFFSNEILDNYLVLGSFGVAPNRDMDLFLMAEYHGWLPTASVEFYRMVRNTREDLLYFNGVWTAPSDLQFVLTQGSVALDMIVPKHNQLRLDITAGNYRTTIQEHLVNGFQQGGISYDYFNGWDWGVRWRQDGIALRKERDINPSGYRLDLSLRDNHHTFLTGYGFDKDTGSWKSLEPTFRYSRTDLNAFFGYRIPPLGNTVLSNQLDLSFIDNNGIDDFFWEFAGGLPGLRGYPFYSLKGTRKVVDTFSLRFPILQDSYRRLFQLTLRDVYLGFHGQVGSAWQGLIAAGSDQTAFQRLHQELQGTRWVKDLGASLRVNWFSFYAFPTALELGAYYGLDELQLTTDTQELTYGGEWRYYWRLLFNFQ